MRSLTDRNYMDDMGDALTYEGGNRLKAAWLMARASYSYTASFIGQTDPSVGEPVFTRWDAVKGAVECFFYCLRRKD